MCFADKMQNLKEKYLKFQFSLGLTAFGYFSQLSEGWAL